MNLFSLKIKNIYSLIYDSSVMIPWIRYIARWLDYLGVLFVSGIAIKMFDPKLKWLEIFLVDLVGIWGMVGYIIVWGCFFILFFYFFLLSFLLLEAFLLSTLGSTPGKWLMGVVVKDRKDNVLSFSTAFKRTFKIWFLGFGLKIPILSILCQLIAYSEFKKNNIFVWDRDLALKVYIKKVNVLRLCLGIGIVVTFFIYLREILIYAL